MADQAEGVRGDFMNKISKHFEGFLSLCGREEGKK
jgi:hypothetical protein